MLKQCGIHILLAAMLGGAGLCAAATPTFTRDAAPILQRNCQECHRPGEIGPFSLITYEQTRPWAKAIKAAVLEKKMPPWFADPHYGKFSNDRSLSQQEIDTLVNWVDGGAPKGDPQAMPPPGNRYNPDPSKEVTWGDQSWDEMMVGFFNLVFDARTPIDSINRSAKREEPAAARND